MTRAILAGVDVGGTFTDFVLIGEDGSLAVRKRPSTPWDPAEGVLLGLKTEHAEDRLAPGFTLAHGTTVATNALLERRGARTALITTRGMRDVLEIGRQSRETLYTFHPSGTLPLVARTWRYEINERLDWRGEVLTPPDQAQAETLLESLAAQGVESVAVCLLFSYLNPAHEQWLGRLAQGKGLMVSLSSAVAPEPREYERTATTVANAFVVPVMARYLERLSTRLREVGTGSLRIMQSNGGALSASEAGAQAIKTALSGPAGGIVAAAAIGEEAGFTDLLTFDMGGTSTDVALLRDGRCPVVLTGSLAGMPLRTPMLDIHTVGAGGGSLTRIDVAGGLRVGPQSAGADPGPVAYGKGTVLTVTDANLLLGRLPADVRLAGQVHVDVERVRAHFRPFTAQLDCTAEAAALGILRIADTAMARALRHISLERGQDPAEYTLLSFGGAGGLHACALADALGMRAVLVPRYPGAFSALGLALADVTREYVRALPAAGGQDLTGPAMPDRLRLHFAELEGRAAQDLEREGFPLGRWQGQRLLDMRYVGQSFDLRVPLLDTHNLATTVATFHTAHRERFGHSDPRQPVEIVALRLIAVGRNPRPRLRPELPHLPGKPLRETAYYTETGWQPAPVYARETLAEGQPLTGPAIIMQLDATTLLPAGWHSSTDPSGNLVFRKMG